MTTFFFPRPSLTDDHDDDDGRRLNEEEGDAAAARRKRGLVRPAVLLQPQQVWLLLAAGLVMSRAMPAGVFIYTQEGDQFNRAFWACVCACSFGAFNGVGADAM
jgi:hypothetical protein